MIYLASPYTSPFPSIRLFRFREACRAAVRLMREGRVVYSPIAHSHPIAMLASLPTDWAFWERIDREFIKRSDELFVLMLPGWSESVGVTAEIEIAKELGKPVSMMVPNRSDELRILEDAVNWRHSSDILPSTRPLKVANK